MKSIIVLTSSRSVDAMMEAFGTSSVALSFLSARDHSLFDAVVIADRAEEEEE